jgi:simple sugar transport system permease protein
MLTDFMDTLDALTPMIFASLAVATAFRAGLFNIGVSGQMLLAGFAATVAVGYSGLPPAAAKPLVLIVGVICGALAGGLIGCLKHRFNINEVVASIMLNYIFQYIISYLINTRFVDPVSRQSRVVSAASRLTLMNVEALSLKTRVPLGLPLALLAAVALKVFFEKTKQGYEMKAVGLNPIAGRYAGVAVGKTVVLSMTMSGALAGLAGVSYYLGLYESIQPGVLSSLGFDSIAVSLLGNSHPIGVIFSSLLITGLTRGGTYMSSVVGIRQEIAALIVGLILLFSACGGYIRHRVALSLRRAERGGA